MVKTWFITGTDTDVGKTVVTCGLMAAAKRLGIVTVGYKPVASGCHWQQGRWCNADALQLQSVSSLTLSYAEVNPYAFAMATAPHIASELAGIPIEDSVMSEGLHLLQKKAQWVLVEGAGGWLTPLSMDHSFAQWVQVEQLPVILVVAIKLGCINHALLSAQGIHQLGLKLTAWVANEGNERKPHDRAYRESLNYLLKVPCLGEIPHLYEDKAETVANFLDLSSLC